MSIFYTQKPNFRIGIYSSNIYVMKRTSLFIDAKTLRDLRHAADRRKVSVASLVREALARYLAEPAAEGRLPSVTGRFFSGKKDTSNRIDELLWSDPHT
jgi:Ribbon-helix-helix protein, copG family